MDENRNEMDKMENTNHASNTSNTSNAGNTSNSNNDTTQDYCPCCPNHCQADALECGKGHGTFRKTAVRVNTFGSIIMDKAMVFMEDVPDILTGKTCPWRISFVPVPFLYPLLPLRNGRKDRPAENTGHAGGEGIITQRGASGHAGSAVRFPQRDSQ